MAKKKINWVAIAGKADFKGSNIIFKPIVADTGPSPGTPQICLLKCDQFFEAGKVSFKAEIKHSDNLAQIAFNHDTPTPQIFAGIGAGGHYGIVKWENNRWDTLISVNPGGKPEPGVYKVDIETLGSNISLSINGVRVCTINAILRKSQIALFFAGPGEIEVSEFSIETRGSKVFVVMQYTPEFDELYAEVIKPTVESFKMESVRADDFYTSGLILNDITQSIIESQIIIADITPDNPNVFYEVGYAHGIGKPVILLSERKREKLPFDVSGFRTLYYDNSIGGKSKVEERLNKFIKSILGA